MMRSILLVVVVTYLVVFPGGWPAFGRKEPARLPVKIAIIGGGVGGTSAAYFLSQLLTDAGKQQETRFSITILEKTDRIGGRLHLVTMDDGRQFEAGGSIIHNRNKHVTDLMKKFGLPKRKLADGSDRLCVLNGEQFVFCESSWSLVTLARLLRQYGLDFFRLNSYVSVILDRFERIYQLQDGYHAYEQVGDLLSAMHETMLELTKVSFQDVLESELKLSPEFIRELVQAITLVNYGQTVSIPALVGMVAFAGAGWELFAIEGGNARLPAALAFHSNARVMLNRQVVSINRIDEQRFRIDHRRSNPNDHDTVQSDIYDYVIIASALSSETNHIRFNNLTAKEGLVNAIFEKYHMHRTVATFVPGRPVAKFRDTAVLSCDIRPDGGSFFTSLSKLSPVDQEQEQWEKNQKEERENVYKVFSNRRLDLRELYALFQHIQHDDAEQIRQIEWLAYPEYNRIQPLPPFKIRTGVYYLNAIEWAASAIEMSLIGGKNVALLVCQEMGRCRKPTLNKTITRAIGTSATKLEL